MKIVRTKITGSNFLIICSGRFGIGSEGNYSAKLIQKEIEQIISKPDLQITEVEIDFLNVEYEWGDGPISAISSVLNDRLKIKYFVNEQNAQPLINLFDQSGFREIIDIEIKHI